MIIKSKLALTIRALLIGVPVVFLTACGDGDDGKDGVNGVDGVKGADGAAAHPDQVRQHRLGDTGLRLY